MLFQAAGAVSKALHKGLALTKGSYKGIVEDHTGELHRQMIILLDGCPRTHLKLLARWPVLN